MDPGPEPGGSMGGPPRTERNLQFPYADFLPLLSQQEFYALKADIRNSGGVRDPVAIDEDGNVLDGHNRLKIDPNAPRRVVSGLTAGEKEAFVYRANFVRRNLSPDQKRECLKRMKATAAKLRDEDKKKNTQKRVAELLGVERSTVAKWFPGKATSDVNDHKASKPDARVILSGEAKAASVDRVEAGESQAQVAADFGVSQQRISQLVKKARKQQTAEAERKKSAEEMLAEIEEGIVHGDYRTAGAIVKDQSVDLIFTDPPYNRETLPQYSDLAAFSSRVLRPGGSLITYLGDYALPEVLQRLLESKTLTFWWPLVCIHTGQTATMRQWGVVVKHKLMLWLVKGKSREPKSSVHSAVESQRDKSHHEWQQGLIEARYYIEKLTAKGGLVVDPYCGGGTTGVAARTLNRTFLGFEIDKSTIVKARKRVHDATV